jgi:hypothetical protein
MLQITKKILSLTDNRVYGQPVAHLRGQFDTVYYGGAKRFR